MPVGNADTITAALGPFFNKPERDLIYGAASTGFFSYNEPSCGGAGINSGVGGQLASAGINSALNAIPIAGPLLTKIFGAINPIAHHAAAVKKEQATLCQAVPDANNFLRGIDAAVAQGQIDFATATQALEQGYQDFRAEIAAILQDTGGKCNAACVYEKHFRAAVEMRKQNYAIATAQNAVGAQGVAGGVVSAVTGAAGNLVSTIRSAISSLTGGPAPVSSFSAVPASSRSLAQAGLTPAP